MRQPIIKFIDYFGRVKEVKEIQKKNIKLSAALERVSFIDEEDKKVIEKLLGKLAAPKKRWFMQPLDVKGSEIPWVREVQETIAKYLGRVSSEQEMDFIQQLFKASEDFFRYQEIFEQNVLFMMFAMTLIVIIITPLIIVYV